MKWIYFSFLLLFTPALLKSQTILSFDFDHSVWVEHYYEAFSGAGRTYLEEANTYVSGDTLINDRIHFKLKRQGRQKNGDHYLLPWVPFERNLGLIYENDGKIFFQDTEEYLLYDFTAKVGDTIDHWFGIPENTTIIEEDSIEMCNQLRRRLKASQFTIDEVFFIEGVGSTSGLVPRYNYFETGAALMCFSDLDCTPCPLVSNTHAQLQQRIMVYPNPSAEILWLKTPELFNESTDVLIYATDGQVYQRSVQSGRISIVDLPKGLYIGRLQIRGIQYQFSFIRQ